MIYKTIDVKATLRARYQQPHSIEDKCHRSEFTAVLNAKSTFWHGNCHIDSH